MKKLKVTCGKKVFEAQLPETWNEMTPEQYLAAVDIWNGGIEQNAFLGRVFSIPENVVSSMGEFLKFSLLEQTKWMRTLEKPCSRFFIETLPNSVYKAPGWRLAGVTLERFMLADNYFQRYAISGDEDFLSVFVAALYHAERTDRDDMQRKVEYCDTLERKTKIAVFLNFMLIRKWLSMAYPFLFPTADDDDATEEPKAKPKPTDWLAIFDAFLGDDVAFIERYKKMLALDAFRLMNRRIKNSKIKQ